MNETKKRNRIQMNVIYFTLLNKLISLKHAIFFCSPKNRKEQKIKYVC